MMLSEPTQEEETAVDEETVDEGRVTDPEERRTLSKRLSNLRHRLAHPEKEKREAWSDEERAALEEKIEELETQLGPQKKREPSANPRPERRKPGDNLNERRALMAAFGRTMGEDVETPDFKRLVKHAERFGTDGVLETASELGYGRDTLLRLADALDRIDAAAYRKDHPKAPPLRFGSTEKRVDALLGVGEAVAA